MKVEKMIIQKNLNKKSKERFLDFLTKSFFFGKLTLR